MEREGGARKGAKKTGKDEDRKGQAVGDVDQDETEPRIEQSERAQLKKKRDDAELRRHHQPC